MNSPTALGTFQQLYATFGPQHWWPANTRVEMVIGAVLVQQSTWPRVATAIGRLRQQKALTVPGLLRLPIFRLEMSLRPTGYYRQKAQRIRHVLQRLAGLYGDELTGMVRAHPDDVRRELLCTTGIGQETADCIVLYATGRPVVVIDAYTRRIATRLGWVPATAVGITALRNYLTAVLPADPVLLNEWHALLVELGKRVCRPHPRCPICPLARECPTATRGQRADRGQFSLN